MTSQHLSGVSDDELAQWAELRADDAGRLARELKQYRSTLSPSPSIMAEPVAWMYEYLKGYDGDMPLWSQPQLGSADPRLVLGDDVRNLIPLFASLQSPYPGVEGTRYFIEHDGFVGTVIGRYTRLDGKTGVVMQQDGTNIVHVYGAKWLKPAGPPSPATEQQEGRK